METSKAHLLVVEDHRSTAMALKQFLEMHGYHVDVADTMAGALSAVTSHSYDMMICDLNLPDGTGWDLLEILRRKRPVRAIAYSAFDNPEHIARSRSAGFVDHVTKGTDPDELLRRIAGAIKAAPTEKSTPRPAVSSKTPR
jgi:DNA-binding response OmpR family regulator